jgi:hypothetical protein
MTTEANRRRARAVHIARAWKWLLAWRGRAAWSWRTVLLGDDQARLRMASEHVLADLRDFTFAETSAFDPDPIIMARRQGRRDVWLRIANYLNLDEETVRKLMEIDDGLGE